MVLDMFSSFFRRSVSIKMSLYISLKFCTDCRFYMKFFIWPNYVIAVFLCDKVLINNFWSRSLSSFISVVSVIFLSDLFTYQLLFYGVRYKICFGRFIISQWILTLYNNLMELFYVRNVTYVCEQFLFWLCSRNYNYCKFLVNLKIFLAYFIFF